MVKNLLITDTFFVTGSNVRQLEEAGYNVRRLDKAAATEDELIDALQDISVYIIGGVEQVTEKVLEAASTLEAIIFTGVDYQKMIPAAPKAEEMGIKLFNAPGANAVGVAEFAVAIALMMQRQLYSISRAGNSKHLTTRTFENAIIGVIGAGNIGKIIIDAVRVFRPSEVLYYNRSSKDVAAQKVELYELVQKSDIVFLTLPMSAGTVFDRQLINRMKSDSLLVSISPNNLIDYDALLTRLQSGDIRAAIDWPSPRAAFDELSMDKWLSFSSHSAFNTSVALMNVNDSVTATAISLIASES